ncbi:MAG: NAD(P)-binding domain-containing protein [Geminicoccaceae bacterium]
MTLTAPSGAPDYDAIIVGAGFSGLYMLHKLRGLGLRTHVFEAAGGVGGTWWWNRYPGARCDVPSVEYSYSFDDALQQEWNWSERYATQAEILAYAEHVADRFDLRRDITFEARVETAVLDEERNLWQVETTKGRASARFLILGTGNLSVPNRPAIPGLDRFRGEVLHTGAWPHEPVDFTGRRVAVIGTGSSAVQSIPQIARDAAQVFVFQRTPAYAVPAHNHELTDAQRAAVKADYAGLRAAALSRRNYINFPQNQQKAMSVDAAARRAEYEARWATGGLSFNGAFVDQLLDRAANDEAAAFVREKIREIVHDPETASRLSPDTIIGCKRLCAEIGFYEAFNRPNVELIDIKKEPIEEVTETGLRAGSRDFDVDAIVLATGFDAMTGSFVGVDPVGVGGRHLREAWAEGPRNYLGLAVSGFPNLFTVTGPGSPAVFSNVLMSIEHHVEWIADCLAAMREAGQTRIEATAEAEADWIRHVAEVAGGTLLLGCNSWYLGANIPGKPGSSCPMSAARPIAPSAPRWLRRVQGLRADLSVLMNQGAYAPSLSCRHAGALTALCDRPAALPWHSSGAGAALRRELMDRLGASGSRMSRHMKVLREVGAVLDRRDAQWVRYRRNPDLAPELAVVIDAVLAADDNSARKVA